MSIDFSGSITASCTISVINNGQLAVSSDQLKLSSKEVGGTQATANVTSNAAGAQIQLLNPTGFATAPSGATSGTTYGTEYTLTGVTMAAQVNGTVATTLLPGLTVMTIHAEAERADTVLPVGTYMLQPTIRCITL